MWVRTNAEIVTDITTRIKNMKVENTDVRTYGSTLLLCQNIFNYNFLWDSYCPIFSILCSIILSSIGCPFVLFHLAIALSVLLLFTIYLLFSYSILYRYIMLGRGICEKYQSRDEKFPENLCHV
jgi:hypothetical protein